jgi:hypothetical protein
MILQVVLMDVRIQPLLSDQQSYFLKFSCVVAPTSAGHHYVHPFSLGINGNPRPTSRVPLEQLIITISEETSYPLPSARQISLKSI